MDKKARMLFKQAEQDQKVRGLSRSRGNKKLGVKSETVDQEFCTGCFAVMDHTTCPNCRNSAKEYAKFCRNCLRVHPNTVKKCETWRPQTANG